MSFTVEQKSQLAKLMATENISVQHSKINTAYFDVKNRVLMLPIWQDMTGNLYDLLTGHEVGHALYTPAEGWHDVVMEKSKGKNYKSFVNVVEDARIEKKIKRKYPGLLTPFRLAYDSLFKKDFFGVDGRDVDTLPFIDRLNIFTKSQYTHNIQFTNEELGMIEKVRNCETWEDVLRVVDEIYDYSKEEQSQLKEMDSLSFGDENDGEYGDEDSEIGEESDEDSESDETSAGSENDEEEQQASDDSESEESESGAESDEESEDESDDDESGTKINRYKDSGASDDEPLEEPRCETDENFRKNESLLLDEKSKEYDYVTLPKPILENIVVGYKDVQNNLTNYYKSDLNMIRSQKLVSDFKNKNDRYISLLAKEFEMRKSAKVYAKGKISETGDIDINKLSSYKFDDNIFRKMMVIPKGKSHGLILLLDCSGSMMHNMHGSIEQILVLASFCRKVNIPFEVYGFNDNANPKFGGDRHGLFKDIYFKYKPNDVALEGNIQLRNYLSSKMSNVEFSKALRNMLILRDAFGHRYYGVPPEENLCATPLIQAVVACGSIMKDFRQKNNLDITNLVIVHDGDADNCTLKYTGDKSQSHSGTWNLGLIEWCDKNVYLVDKDIKFQEKLGPQGDKVYRDYYGSNSLAAYLKWFKKYTQSNVFGFFIVNGNGAYLRNALSDKYVFENGDNFNEKFANVEYEQKKQSMSVLATEMRKNKFLSSKNPGYKQFYFIVGGKNLSIDKDEIEIDGKVTSSKLKNAFMEMNRKKVVNRVLVSKFIQNMAAE